MRSWAGWGFVLCLAAFFAIWLPLSAAVGTWPFHPTERVYACRTPTVTTTTVMPNAAPAVETHAGYPACRRVK